MFVNGNAVVTPYNAVVTPLRKVATYEPRIKDTLRK